MIWYALRLSLHHCNGVMAAPDCWKIRHLWNISFRNFWLLPLSYVLYIPNSIHTDHLLICLLAFWDWANLTFILNSSPPGQNGHLMKCIFMTEKIYILIWISQKFVPKGAIDNKTALVQVMACCQTGNKPLPEPMLPSSLPCICGTREMS